MNFKKYIFAFLLIPLFAFTLHKYYISLCEIEYVEKEQSVQIILGVFIDDFEVTLNKLNDTQLYLATDREPTNIDEIYLEYLNNNFNISINNTLASYTFIGKEYDNDIVRFYLEITDVKELNSIEIKNTNLFSDFEDQQNIIKIKVNKLNKTFYLDKNNANCMLKI